MTNWARPVPLVGDKTSAAERAGDPRAWRFEEEQRRAVYDVIAARRDIRRFLARFAPFRPVAVVTRSVAALAVVARTLTVPDPSPTPPPDYIFKLS